jgi:hypothetical protein
MLPLEPISPTLKLEAVRPSETSEQIQYITWHENPKYDGCLNNKRRKDKNYIPVKSVNTSTLYLFDDHNGRILM